MSMYDPPLVRGKKRCRSRIDGKHDWIYVGGTTARCAECGAEAYYDPIRRRKA